MVVERGLLQVVGTVKACQQEPLRLKDKCDCGHNSSKDHTTVKCCGNASENHILKLVVIGKVKRPQFFKFTKANYIPVHYYNQKGAWMDMEISENWFHKHFVPQVWAFLKERRFLQKVVLLPDNSPSHPRKSMLTSDNGLIIVKLLSSSVTALIQPLDQGVIYIHEMTLPC
jgi:hypothetical protein